MPHTPRRPSSTAPGRPSTPPTEDCVFCAIVARRAPAHRLLEDEHTISFLHIAPATLGHALVVPRYRAGELQPPCSRSRRLTPTWPPCGPGSSARPADRLPASPPPGVLDPLPAAGRASPEPAVHGAPSGRVAQRAGTGRRLSTTLGRAQVRTSRAWGSVASR